jgi:large subunit ribosomal protein L9
MAKMQVILMSNVVGLGAEGDKVEVAAGYARNYLIPEGLAIPATEANERRIEALKRKRVEREAREYSTMQELARSLEKLVCVIKVKTGEDGKMFGAVTAGMIADELKNQFDIVLDKKKIYLEQPIKALGDYQVELHLHPEIKGTLNLRVESLNPLPEAVLAAIEAQRQSAFTQTNPSGTKSEATNSEQTVTDTAQQTEEKKSKKAAKKTQKSRQPEQSSSENK